MPKCNLSASGRTPKNGVLALAESSPVDGEIPRYLNRLSDLLWLLARKFEQEA